MGMSSSEKKIRSELNWKNILFNSLGFITVLSFLLFLRAPILINADNFLDFDEAYQGSQIMDLLNGGPVHFYYEGVSYAGIPLGLAAAPFFLMFGVNAFAYKLPAVIAYALYVVTFYWVMKKINPPAALTVVFLMIFSPISALNISVNNWQHNLIILLGNIIFLLFFKIKESITPRISTVFLFGLVIGFSIYSYTYSILYIASVAILFVLTHDGWSSFREKISINLLIDWWNKQLLGKIKLVRVIDIVIICFLMAILFSYIFGGFGIDIAGYSIFQINNLHKPVFQVLIIIAIRIFIYREDIKSGLVGGRISIIFEKYIPIRFIFWGIIGFILGILPRILSIVTGEVTRGGQGFDIDFSPIKLIVHLWELISYHIPKFFDIREPIIALFYSEWSSWIILRAGLAIIVSLLILIAIFNFLSSQKVEIKKMAQFKRLEYFPDMVFVVFPILLFSAVIVSQNGTLIRYLLPLHGVVSICVGIYLNKIRSVSKVRFATFLLVWCVFSLVNTYSFYTGSSGSSTVVMRGFSVVKLDNHFYDELLEYCDSNNIKHVYSDLVTAAPINFFSKGNIIAGVYNQDKTIRRKNQILSLKKSFSIVIANYNEHHLKTYQAFLDETPLKFSKELVDNKFWVFTDFVGDPADVQRLRHLIPINF
jgi:hypothetical protein